MAHCQRAHQPVGHDAPRIPPVRRRCGGISLNTNYAASKEANFWCNEMSSITIDKVFSTDENGVTTELTPTEEKPLAFSIEFLYGKEGKGIIHRCLFYAKGFPYEVNLVGRHIELPSEGVTVKVRWESGILKYFNVPSETQKSELLGEFYLAPDESYVHKLDQDGVKATFTYKPSTWSAVDIHWGMQKTYDYYKEIFNRNSYDDKGVPIINLLYMPDTFTCGDVFIIGNLGNSAAMSLPPYPMIYGGSDDLTVSNMVELSIIAHEFTHLITSATADLVYEGESGALNESFSDIFGISVLKYANGDDSLWELGKGVSLRYSSLRDIAFPKRSGDGSIEACPDTYYGEYWQDVTDFSPTGDNGGVHSNSGVQNKWYYLLTDGDSGTNDHGFSYNVTGIGIKKAEQIAYLTLTEYATSKAQYADIRLCSHQAAQRLYGDDSAEAKAVIDAWDAVGVMDEGNPTTSIETVSIPAQSDFYYDLQGRQVSQPESGFYIKNGRKIMVR